MICTQGYRDSAMIHSSPVLELPLLAKYAPYSLLVQSMYLISTIVLHVAVLYTK